MSNAQISPSQDLPTNRKFGFFFAGIFALAGCYSIYKDKNIDISVLMICISAVLVTVALFSPRLLAPLNKSWFKLGILLEKITSPMILGAIFFLLITPIAITSRALGRDALKLKRQTGNTYWNDRNPVGPDSNSFNNQF